MSDTYQTDAERRKARECKHEVSIQALKASENSMQKTLDGVSVKLDMILAQITKVAVLEEKHSSQTADVNRAHKYIKDIDDKHAELAKEARAFINQAKGMWAVIAFLGLSGLLTLIKVMFFMGPH